MPITSMPRLKLGLLAGSPLGRFFVLLIIFAGENDPREERHTASWVVVPDGAPSRQSGRQMRRLSF